MTGSEQLSTAISRLEQVTERLLRFEASLAGKGGPAAAHSTAHAASNGNSTSNGTPAAPAVASNGASAGGSAGSGLAAYDKLLQEQLAPFMEQATALGGEVLDASKHVEQAFQEQRNVLALAVHAKQPDVVELQQVLQPVAQHMMEASSAAENRRSTAFNQLKVVAEALQGLSWLAYTGPNCGLHPPAQHISECWNSAEFFSNKLLKDFRGVDDRQVAWAKQLKDLFTGLQAFVRVNMPTGVKWNPSGGSIAAAKAAAGTAAAAAAAPAAKAAAAPAKPSPARGGPKGPPPPPPPPANLSELLLKERPGAKPAPAAAAGGGMQEVLKALSQGTAVTSGLRKVTDDMKTKNRADRSGHVNSTSTPPAAAPKAAPSKPAAAAARGPPRLELQQERKWVVENQVDQQELVVTVTDPKHSVYIYNCSGSVVQVKGKCNAISIDKCHKTGVVFEDVIASCELVNCNSVQVQCTGSAPTVSIDKCDGVQAYIPAALSANPNFQVVTAKSSEVNLVLVAADPSAEDVVEHPVPEQFISTFKDGKLVTTAASHGGG